MTKTRAIAMIPAAVLLAMPVVACTHEVAGVAVAKNIAEGVPDACSEVSPPLVPVPSEADDEPRLLIPKPSGWERTSDADSELVRFAMTDASLTGSRLAIAAVALKSKVGHDDPETVFDDLRRDAQDDPGTTDLKFADSTVCGYPAKTIDYTRLAKDLLPTRTETMLAAVAHTTGKTHVAIVTLSTNDADSPTYQRDLDTILTGFQVLAPSG